MTALTTFDSTKESLQTMLGDIRSGRTQLPDFQRGWVWDDERIRSLLASVSLSYPIGTVMMMETGNVEARFKPRLIEGLELPTAVEPERLILDGQQRLTALFLALMCNSPVQTKDERGNSVLRWYYLDIQKCLSRNGDREEAIVGLPADRITRDFRGRVLGDYSTPEAEQQAELLPLRLIFDVSGLTDWMLGYLQLGTADSAERASRWKELSRGVIQRIQQYQVPLILLRKETPKEAVCQVFEKVNTGGVSLTVFELLTATYAVDDFSLRDDWANREKRFRKHRVLSSVASTDFLQAITLLTTRSRRLVALAQGVQPQEAPGISCRRREILRLSLTDYQAWADPVEQGFREAAKLLHTQKLFNARDLPYGTQLTPLAAALSVLGSDAETHVVQSKLARWYWSGVLGELYGGAIEARFARDLPEIIDWVNGGPEPSTVTEANFSPPRLLTMRTRNSAAYKGIHALLMREGALDLRTGQSIDTQIYFDERIDIHHVFPQAWCTRNSVPLTICNSIINKTPISARTNRIVGGNAPSQYIARLERVASTGAEAMDQILRSHLIDPKRARADDFWGFAQHRALAILEKVEQAMGKPVAREQVDDLVSMLWEPNGLTPDSGSA